MKIAVTYDNGNIFQHFGHTEKIKIYNIENGNIESEKIEDTSATGHSLLVEFLKNNDIKVLICGGIGQGAVNALTEAGIELYSGNEGNADNIVKMYIKGNLEQNNDANCNHHNGEHNCKGHDNCSCEK